jgi:hypothetical protein
MMSLLEKFQIAFRRREENTWIVPSLLAEEPSPTAKRQEEATVSHARRYVFKVCMCVYV